MHQPPTNPPHLDSPGLLSPAVSYHVRKLLRQNLDQLTPLAGSSQHVTEVMSDPSSALELIYTDELEREAVVQQLEQLAKLHQDWTNQGLKRRQEIKATEEKIFRWLGFELRQESRQGNILIVDDTPDNLRLLSTALIKQGYVVRNAINGALALSSAQVMQPDLILLDIMMPGMDGYEVCRRLKANPKTSDIPVIFISAIDESLDKVKAFSVGGVDYVTKPVQIEEVLVRIEHQLKLWNLQKRLEEQNVRLQQDLLDRDQADAHYQTLLERSVDGVFQIAIDGRFVKVNPALAQLYGYGTPETLLQSSSAPALYADSQAWERFTAHLQHYESVHNLEAAIVRPDGSKIWVAQTACVVKDAAGQVLYYEGTVKNITSGKEAEEGWRRGKHRNRRLLLSMFPKTVAKQYLSQENATIADRFTSATILVAHLVGIGSLTTMLPPDRFIQFVSELVSQFDHRAESLGIEIYRSAGNYYVAVAGAPKSRPGHAVAIVELALTMQQILLQYRSTLPRSLQLRIGIHTGGILAGVVGRKRLSYDLWGETLDMAYWLEQEGMSDRIHLSAMTAEHLPDQYDLERRVVPSQRDRSQIMTYWLSGKA